MAHRRQRMAVHDTLSAMQFAAVQFDIVWEDKPANHAIIDRMLDDARLPAGSFAVLPELADTGFSMNLDRIADDQSLAWATQAARRLEVYLQHGFARLDQSAPAGGNGLNCAAVISPAGGVLGTYCKVHPFSYGREAQHYHGGDGLVLIDCGGATVCPLICYDLRFPELWRLAALAGAEVFTIGASWPAARQAHWRSLLVARAIENQAFVVAVNRVGSDPHLSYAGGSIIVSPKGEVIAEAGDKPIVLSADLDLELLRAWRKEFPALPDAHRDLLGSIRIQRHGG